MSGLRFNSRGENKVMSSQMTAFSLWSSTDNREKKDLMEAGFSPDREYLIGAEYKGLNTGFLPGLFGVRKFIKTFYLEDVHKLEFGNNFRVKQNDPEDEHIKLLKDGQPIAQGYFLVLSLKKMVDPKWSHYKRAAFLNYGHGGNKWYEPAKVLRDYIVQPFEDNPNILLGHAYFAVAGFQISGAFFVLERIKKE